MSEALAYHVSLVPTIPNDLETPFPLVLTPDVEYEWRDLCATPLFSVDSETYGNYKSVVSRAKDLSTCCRAHIGCGIFNRYTGACLATGYNHKPAGDDVSCEDLGCVPKETCRYTIHAEVIALRNLREAGVVTDYSDLIMVCQAAPCLDCTKALIANGITTVYFWEMRPQPIGDRPAMSALMKHLHMYRLQEIG